MVILDDHVTEVYFDELVRHFEQDVLAYYYEQDLQNGYITTTNRRGEVSQFPLITLAVVTVNNLDRTFKNAKELAKILAGLKKAVKGN